MIYFIRVLFDSFVYKYGNRNNNAHLQQSKQERLITKIMQFISFKISRLNCASVQLQ